MEGQVALVTGASRGIGAALARSLAARGVEVVCVARSTAARPSSTRGTLDETVAAIRAVGGRAHAVVADMREEERVRDAVRTAIALTGRLDILVNNAAAAVPGDWSAPRKRWDLLLDVNVRAPMVATQEAVAHFAAAGEGRVVNVSSIAATHAIAPLELYGLSKAALEHLTVSTAAALAGRRVAVNCLRVDIPVASEGAMHWDRYDGSPGWLEPQLAADALMAILDQPVQRTGQIVDLSDVAVADQDVRRAGRALARHASTPVRAG